MDEFQFVEKEKADHVTVPVCLKFTLTLHATRITIVYCIGPRPVLCLPLYSPPQNSPSHVRPQLGALSFRLRRHHLGHLLRANRVRVPSFDLHPAFLLTTCLVRAPLQTPNTFPLGAFYLKLPHSSVTFTGLKPILPRLTKELWHDI